MSEQLKNGGMAFLNGAIDAVQTSLVVDNAASFPATGVFTILVQNELMRVTAVAANTFTVVRAEEGTAGATHADGIGVACVQTARSVEAFRAEHVTAVAYASHVAGRKGRLNLTTNGPLTIYEDATVNLLGPDFEPRILPVTANFSWLNQGGATITDFQDFSQLIAPANAGDSLRIREIVLPSPPWSVLVELDSCHVPVSGLVAGLCLRESATGKIRSFGMDTTSGGSYFDCLNWNNPTTFGGSAFVKQLDLSGRGFNLRWHKLRYDGTNVQYLVGPHKQSLIQVDLRAKNYHFTTAPDRVGLVADTSNASTPSILNVYSWEEGT